MIRGECPHLDCLYNIDGKCHDARFPDSENCPNYKKRLDAIRWGGAEVHAAPLPHRLLVHHCARHQQL